MKRKLFCLLTLLLAVCSGAWADETVTLAADGTNKLKTWTSGNFSVAFTTSNDAQKAYVKLSKDDTGLFATTGSETITSVVITYGTSSSSITNTATITVPSTSDDTKFTASTTDNAVTITATAQVYISSTKVYYTTGGGGAANAPATPNFTPDGGSVNGVSTVTVASTDASKIYYYWSDESTPAAVGNAAYTEASGNSVSVTVPNETKAAKYLHAYGWNDYNEGSTSSIYSKSFNITAVSGKSTWDFTSIVADDFSSNTTFWSGSGTSGGVTYYQMAAGKSLSKSDDPISIPNKYGLDMCNGLLMGNTNSNALAADRFFLFIGHGFRADRSGVYFTFPATVNDYYKITFGTNSAGETDTEGFLADESYEAVEEGSNIQVVTSNFGSASFVLKAKASTVKLAIGGTKAGRTILKKIEPVKVLNGAWSDASNEFYQGDAAPEVPTFSVTASDASSITKDTHYTVTYELKEGSTAGIVTYTEGGGISAISNSTTGSATVIATVASLDDNYMVITSTYEYTVTVNAKVPNFTLNKVDNEISLRSTPIHRNAEPAVSETATVTMSADFLAGTSGTVAFTTDVDGLSVSPAAFTIIDGSVTETEFTITYNSASGGASGTATLRFSDGTNNKDLIIEYASVVPHEWATVSETTTWDWTTFGYARNASVKLTTETTPTKSEEFNFADMDGEVLAIDAKIPVSFNGAALLLTSEYPIRDQSDNEFWQGSKIRIKTSVPGRLYVKYSNTGGNPERFLTINGAKRGEGTSNATFIEVSDVAVPAGIITLASLEGETPSNLRIQKIIFTADPGIGQKSIEITCEGGLASYSCTTDGLDFSTSNVKAYIVTAKSSSYATLTEVTKAPANTGLIIMGTKGQTYNVLTTDEATSEDVKGNLLEATGVSGTAVEKDAAYVLSKTDGKLHLTNAGTIPAGKAYLPAGAVGARILDLSFGDEEGETTSLNEVRGLKSEVRGEFYNLNGQRVAQPTKGLYIVNGRKVVIK